MQRKCSSLSLRGRECEKLVNPRNARESRMRQVKMRNHCLGVNVRLKQDAKNNVLVAVGEVDRTLVCGNDANA